MKIINAKTNLTEEKAKAKNTNKIRQGITNRLLEKYKPTGLSSIKNRISKKDQKSVY